MPAAVYTAAIKRTGDVSTEGFAAALAEPGDWLSVAGELLREDVEQRFQTQTDPWGAAWAPHSPTTIIMRQREGKPGRILIKDRYLANSFAARLDESAARVIIFSGGPSAAYGAAQQFGNPNNKMFGKHPAPIPPRAMLPLRPNGKIDMPPRLLAELRVELQAAFAEAVKRHSAGGPR